MGQDAPLGRAYPEGEAKLGEPGLGIKHHGSLGLTFPMGNRECARDPISHSPILLDPISNLLK